MRKISLLIAQLLFGTSLIVVQEAYADAAGPHEDACDINQRPSSSSQPASHAKSVRFSPFTGSITGNKVRVRLQPNLESPILREMNTNDLVVVTGEEDTFFAIEPFEGVKGYIYRTYILDGVVDANHVNVRLEPDLNAPIILQLNAGEKVTGNISERDKKWIEIPLPASTRFYISKEYLTKIGDADLITVLKKHREEAKALLNSASAESVAELQKPVNQINLDGIMQKLNTVITKYQDAPEESAKAKEMLSSVHTAYLNKRLVAGSLQQHTQPIVNSASTEAPKEISQIPEPSSAIVKALQPSVNDEVPLPPNSKMAAWVPVEQQIYQNWASQNNQAPILAFYQQQAREAIALRGIIEPYARSVKNKPGDFVLVNPSTHQTIGFLYSTQVNLQEKIGQEVTVRAVSRDNNHFAYPAYFVVATE